LNTTVGLDSLNSERGCGRWLLVSAPDAWQLLLVLFAMLPLGVAVVLYGIPVAVPEPLLLLPTLLLLLLHLLLPGCRNGVMAVVSVVCAQPICCCCSNAAGFIQHSVFRCCGGQLGC
jgi:hypothetical protein